jgi:opacity protein-like surface antigen
MVLFTVATWVNPPWGQPSEGNRMKRLLLSSLLLLGSAGAARAQVSAPTLNIDRGNAAPDFSATSGAKAALLGDLAAADTFSTPAAKPDSAFAAPVVATALALPLDNAEPATPSPRPKFLYGGRDDYRWELGLAASWLRFRSSVFNASAVGINTSVTYFTNEWFGVEGGISAVFAPTILVGEHVKIATFGAGPKIAYRRNRWEPWLHGIFGGAHEQPQIAGSSRNSYAIKAGGGADYHWNPRVSFRLEGDYVRTGFFKQSQNNFQLSGGIVFHF